MSGPLDGLARRVLRVGERRLLARETAPAAPCVFVLGLPRSGTTLVYQYLVHRLALAYFTNGVGRFPGTPAAVTWLQQRLHGPYCSDFRSRYGKVEGPAAPREAGAFWGRFFGYQGYRRFEDLGDAQVDLLRRSLAAVQRVFGGAAFVNKNVKHVLRVDALARLFPGCLFVVVERDLRDVALSVHRARHALLDDPREWWSVRPEGAEALEGRPVEEQVAGQLAAVRERLERDLGALAAERVLRIDYADFCADPEASAVQLRRRVGPVGLRNAPVRCFDVARHAPEGPGEQRLCTLLAGVEPRAYFGERPGGASRFGRSEV